MTPSRALGLIAAAWAIAGCAGVSPAARGERGAQAVRDGDWIAAFAAYDAAVVASPDELPLRRERVRSAHRAGRLPLLMETLRAEADGQAPTGPDIYELALAVAHDGAAGSDVEALRLLEQAAEALPEEADIPYRMGLIRLEQELFCAAARPLERSAEMDTQAVSPRIALAAARLGCGQRDSAREAIAELLRLSPTEGEVRRARGVLARLNNPISQVPEGLRPAYRDALSSLGEESSPGEVIQIVEEALEAAPECAPLLTLLGLANVRLGQLARATVAFERAVELWPADPTPHLELAAIATEAGRGTDAEEHLLAALEVDPLNVDGWTELGRLRYQRRSYPEAASAFRRLSAIDGGALVSRLWLGRTLRRAGRDEEAEEVYLALLEARPRTFEACVQLGHIYRRRRVGASSTAEAEEMAARARRYYQLALDVRPQDPMVQRMLSGLEDEASE